MVYYDGYVIYDPQDLNQVETTNNYITQKGLEGLNFFAIPIIDANQVINTTQGNSVSFTGNMGSTNPSAIESVIKNAVINYLNRLDTKKLSELIDNAGNFGWNLQELHETANRKDITEDQRKNEYMGIIWKMFCNGMPIILDVAKAVYNPRK